MAQDVVVRWRGPAHLAHLRAALAEHLGHAVPGLAAGGRLLADDVPLGLPPLLDGVSLAVVTDRAGVAGDAGGRPPAVLSLAVVGGPDAGRSLPLSPPGMTVGRGPTTGLRLEDPALSRSHCRVALDAHGVHVEDLEATNGVLVDGRPRTGRTSIDTSSTVVVGASTLRIRRAGAPGSPATPMGDGTVAVAPLPSPPRERAAEELLAPRAPDPPTRTRVPWVAALAPVPVVAGLAVFLGPHVLAFAVLGPVVLLATALSDRIGRRRRHRRECAQHEVAMAAHEKRVAAALAHEAAREQAACPDPHAVLSRAERRGPGLWSAGCDPTVRLGLGSRPSACTVVDAQGHADRPGLHGVPVTVALPGTLLAFVGPSEVTDRALAAVVGQLVTAWPPSALSVHLAGADAPGWAWLSLLPHHGAAASRPLLVAPDAAAAGASQRLAAVAAEGGLVLAAARHREALPPHALAVDVGGGPAAVAGPPGTSVVVDGVGPAWCDRLARALAPLRSCGPGTRPLPSEVSLGELLGLRSDDAGWLRARWAAAAGPTATVGVGPSGPLVVDLRTDGPHVLVGGTTGSGKSEFLRTLVTGLALDSPPEELTLLLVDFKGGAAFGPCAGLPHVVGLVTDLDDRLVRRVLRALEAELRRREELLARLGAADLEAAARRWPSDEPALPRLVVVVDELRALVDEHPDALTALVRIAAQGRSLGLHLVLATQRPAGTVTAQVQANVNLRIAFRVRDRSDAVHVVEDERAALLPADVPGRGVARGGDGVLTEFQAALATPAPSAEPQVIVLPASRDAVLGPAGADHAEGLADLVRLLRQVHTGPAPRRPWLPPLASRLTGDGCPPGTVALVDDPDRQRVRHLAWSEQTPLWRVVGPARSGRTQALRSLVHAAAELLAPSRLHVQVLGGALADLRALPHVGTVAPTEDQAAVGAVLDHLEHAARGEDAPLALLVVDGLDRLEDDTHAVTPAGERVARLVRDARALVAVAGGRDLLRPRWAGLGGEALLLGPRDPLDAALLGTPLTDVGTSPTPGRGVLARDGCELQVVLTPADGSRPLAGGAPGAAPWTYRALPRRVLRREVLQAPTAPGWLLGLTGPSAEPWAWSPERDGRLLLLAGPPGSGRSTALRTLARSAALVGQPLVCVCPDPSAPPTWPSVDDAVTAGDVDRLVALRRRHPGLLVLVDDADRLDDAPVRPVLEEITELLHRDGGAMVVAGSSTALASRLRGLDARAARERRGLLLRPRQDDGHLLGLARAALPADPGPPGRGVLVLDSGSALLQVLTDEEGPSAVSPGDPSRR
ncbi:hypothetical protein GCM10012283_08440 [Phycicoccus endophyticus]|nr:hypothetical protein GCM10012283_08440 [Phycicoccus endophyticus]